MILSVFYKGDWYYPESPSDTGQLASEVMAGIRGEEEADGNYFPGEDSWFCLAGGRRSDENPVAGSMLRVAVNRRTGYGALVWFVDEGFEKSGGIYDSVWVSNGQEPPHFDPRVVSDPGYPLFHDPASVIPCVEVRAAVEEFCRAGSGDRPECISWVPGHMNGQRLDRPPMVDFAEDPEMGWDGL